MPASTLPSPASVDKGLEERLTDVTGLVRRINAVILKNVLRWQVVGRCGSKVNFTTVSMNGVIFSTFKFDQAKLVLLDHANKALNVANGTGNFARTTI